MQRTLKVLESRTPAFDNIKFCIIDCSILHWWIKLILTIHIFCCYLFCLFTNFNQLISSVDENWLKPSSWLRMNEQVPLYLHHCQQMQQQKLVAACHTDSFWQMAWNWLAFWKIVWAKLYHDYSKKSLSGIFRSRQRFSIVEHLRIWPFKRSMNPWSLASFHRQVESHELDSLLPNQVSKLQQSRHE